MLAGNQAIHWQTQANRIMPHLAPKVWHRRARTKFLRQPVVSVMLFVLKPRKHKGLAQGQILTEL